MARLTIKEWFKTHGIDIDNDGRDTHHVLCIHNGYNPHFYSGTYYSVKLDKRATGSVMCIKSAQYNITGMDSHEINKMFVPLEGTPSKQTVRDKLLIRIRYGKN